MQTICLQPSIFKSSELKSAVKSGRDQCRLNSRFVAQMFAITLSSLTDTAVVNAYFGHFDIFISMESSLHRASNGAINLVVF